MISSRDQLLARNFDAVLAIIVKLAGDTIFAKFCQDALSHTLRRPRSKQTLDVVGMGWDASVWVEMYGDGCGWVVMGGCSDGRWERQFLPRNCFVYLPASFSQHFESLWMDPGGSWAQIGVRLSTMAPH